MFLKVVKSKTILNSLSDKFGGPGSVYGIGPTSIRRVVDTVTDSKANAKKQNFEAKYDDETLYADGSYPANKSVDAKKNSLSKKIENTKYNTSTPGVYITDNKGADTKFDISRSDTKSGIYKDETNGPFGIHT